MIEKQTVLVLGAGASMPYGLPSGSDLRRLIINGLDINRTTGIPSQLINALTDAGFSQKQQAHFRKELLVADTTSIDVFLERRTEFLDIGKAAIAATLIPLESNQALFEPWKEPVPGRAKQTWYQYFVSTLRMDFSNWGLHRLTIITYNYDRSLDHYLFNILRTSCSETPASCWKKFREIPIIHLYGELGVFNPLDEDSLPFGSQLNRDNVMRAAEAIRIVSENQDNKRFERANVVLDEAELVCFLGFGYAPENMRRLKLKANTAGRQVLGTAYQLTEAERRRLRLDAYLDSPFPSDWDILRALRESQVLG